MKVKEFFQTSQGRYSYYRDLLGVDKYVRIANFIYEMDELMSDILSSSLHIAMKDSLIKDLIEMTHYRVRKIEKDDEEICDYCDCDDEIYEEPETVHCCPNCGYDEIKLCDHDIDEVCLFCWRERLAEDDSICDDDICPYCDDDDLDLEDDFSEDDEEDCCKREYECWGGDPAPFCPNCGYVAGTFYREGELIERCEYDQDEACPFCGWDDWNRLTETMAEEDSMYDDDDELDLEDDFEEDDEDYDNCFPFSSPFAGASADLTDLAKLYYMIANVPLINLDDEAINDIFNNIPAFFNAEEKLQFWGDMLVYLRNRGVYQSDKYLTSDLILDEAIEAAGTLLSNKRQGVVLGTTDLRVNDVDFDEPLYAFLSTPATKLPNNLLWIPYNDCLSRAIWKVGRLQNVFVRGYIGNGPTTVATVVIATFVRAFDDWLIGEA